MPRLVVSIALVTLLGACSANLLTGHEPLSKGSRGNHHRRANRDGSAPDQVFVRGVFNPCGVAVDAAHLYWVSEGDPTSAGGTIGRANLDGSGVDHEFILTDAVLPCGVAVDEQHLNWGSSDPGAPASGLSIGRADLDGRDVNQLFVTGMEGVCGVALDP